MYLGYETELALIIQSPLHLVNVMDDLPFWFQFVVRVVLDETGASLLDCWMLHLLITRVIIIFIRYVLISINRLRRGSSWDRQMKIITGLVSWCSLE